MSSKTPQRTSNQEEMILPGVTICPGLAVGHVYVVDCDLPLPDEPLEDSQVEGEIQRYRGAVANARERLDEHIMTAHGNGLAGVQAILDIHRIMLDDASFHERVRHEIKTQRRPAEWSVREVADTLLARFHTMRDPYLQARAEDVRDMAHQVIAALTGCKHTPGGQPGQEAILASRHLHASDSFMLQRTKGRGLASESRALTSHAAILLKGFGIPAVGSVDGLFQHVQTGMQIIVDGTDGLVILNPSPRTLSDYRRQGRVTAAAPEQRRSVFQLQDGGRITLRANIEHPNQMEDMQAEQLQGIGLFRTEFLIGEDGSIPSEESQHQVYRRVLEQSGDKQVVIRTFDLGGDKSMGLQGPCTGRNPSLGLRGIRRHLIEQPEELRTQLRAILRASVAGKAAILIPMITTIGDATATRDYLTTVQEELAAAGTPFSPDIPLGLMIETPAAALSMRELLDHAAFVSIGSNDLLQYLMAADRDNERVAHYNNPASPAFLRIMKQIIQVARRAGRDQDVTVCGEVSAEPETLARLLAMGYRTFSLAPHSARQVRPICEAFTARDLSTCQPDEPAEAQ